MTKPARYCGKVSGGGQDLYTNLPENLGANDKHPVFDSGEWRDKITAWYDSIKDAFRL